MKLDEKFWKKLEELLDRKLEEKLDAKLDAKFDEKLKGFATKDDLKEMEERMESKFDKKVDNKFEELLSKISETDKKVDNKFEEFLDRASKVFVYQHEHDEQMAYIKENMLTRGEFHNYMEQYEDLLQEIRDSRRGRLLTEKHVSDMDDTIDNHEKRIRILEKQR